MQENERILMVLLSVLCRVLFPMTFAKYRDNCKAIFSPPSHSLSLSCLYSYDVSLVIPFIVLSINTSMYKIYTQNFLYQLA